MNINDIGDQIVSGAYPIVKEDAENLANNTYRSRKEVAASVCHTEHEREAVIASEDIMYELTQDGTSYRLHLKEKELSLAEKLINEGKPAPVTKGPDGTITDITGETIPAKSHYEGFVVEEYAWPATNFIDETNTMLETLEPEIIREGIVSYAKENAAGMFAPYIAEELKGGLS